VVAAHNFLPRNFGLRYSYSYRLLHHGEIIHYLTSAGVAPMGATITEAIDESPIGDSIPEWQTRPIKKDDLPRLTKTVREKVAQGVPGHLVAGC
jgi:hypothetical protein